MKIVIINEPNYQAGGIECIYQFCDIANILGYDCSMKFAYETPNPILDVYKKYKNVKVISEIPDEEDVIVIYAEIWTNSVYDLKKSKKAIWWLSVDNNKKAFKNFNDDSILHIYQSEYARQFLIGNGAKNVIEVTDYTDGIFYNNSPKKDIITYNPFKGQEATQFLIRNAPHLKFVPLCNMSREQILETLSSSKVYIDFGHHPGRDRIPREAVLCKNILFTSCLGSAKNSIDIPIPEAYKLKELNNNTPELFVSALQNYNEHINNFEPYFQSIKRDKETFINQIKNFKQYIETQYC